MIGGRNDPGVAMTGPDKSGRSGESGDRASRITGDVFAAALALLLAAPLAAGAPPPAPPRFAERAAELGIDFVHRHFGTGEKYMPENMAPGVVLFDADGDGRLDLYLPQGAPFGGAAVDGATNRLFRQKADGSFEDVTARAGVGDRGYGMGASFGDLDRDGDLDLYVTNYGANVLYRNRGDGTFEDITEQAGVDSPAWSVSSGFFDADGDGDLDLFVVHYVDFGEGNHKWCGSAQRKIRGYCHPDVYDGLPDVFYRNQGVGADGVVRFSEASEQAGIVATTRDKGLGVLFGDLDADGHQDIYVTNDSTMNYLYLGDGRGKFEESALFAGVGLNGAGGAEASMGVALGDLDGDGLAEIFLTHLDQETNTLYRGLGDGTWDDRTAAAGLAAPSLPRVGFGTVFLDHDNDGDLDIFVTNGHIIDNIELLDPGGGSTHRQPSQLFDNLGDGTFEEITAALDLPDPMVGRGAARGDLDRDGDIDLVFTQNGDRAVVLLNRWGTRANSLAVRLAGKKSNLQGFGARLELAVGKSRQTREALSSSSYMSQNAPEVYFGLGAAKEATGLVVRWPSGQIDRHGPLAAGSIYKVTEGSTEVEAEAFAPARP